MNKRIRLFMDLLVLLAVLASACAPAGALTSTPEHANRPGTPVYEQLVWDCNTGKTLPADYSTEGPIQPDSGCDSWQINRYERPFNKDTQDVFFPDLDILSGELGSDGTWFYFRMTIFDENQSDTKLTGTYAIELDLDLDGRGDVVALAHAPGEDATQDWTTQGVQFWGDINNDVGNEVPLVPDPPNTGNGYDTLVFDSGQGDDPDLAWVRTNPGKPAVLELAFKASAILDDPQFKWLAWTDEGVDNRAGSDYHDTFDHPVAGDPIVGQAFFPSQSINELDNTCSVIWGAPQGEDLDLCVNDPSVPPPTLQPSETPTSDITPTPSNITPTPPDDQTATPTKPTTLISATVTLTSTATNTATSTATPCLPQQSATAPQPTCIPTPTNTNTPTPTNTSTPTQTATPTVCFIYSYDQAGLPVFLPCIPSATPTVTPTQCVQPYPFAVIPCDPTPTYTPSVTPTVCTPTPTLVGNPTGTGTTTTTVTNTPTSITAPNFVPCGTFTPTATLCVVGAAVTNLVVCTPTPVPTICTGPNVAGALVQCTPTPPQSSAMMVYPDQDTNCRRAPNDQNIVDTLFKGVGYIPLGRTPDNQYMLLRGPASGQRCWAASFLFTIPFGPLSGVPGSVLPYINYPTATPTPTKVPPSAPQCSDGVDNDGDGRIDYSISTSGSPTGDRQCTSASDNSEAN